MQKRHLRQPQRCYKATVNESETITEAKPLWVIGGCEQNRRLPRPLEAFPPYPCIERS
jgi:hypothetical protein